MPEPRVLLVSIKPVYADLLISGHKTVELRRVKPNVPPRSLVLLYASSPTMEMVATASVKEIETGAVADIWRRRGPATGLDRSDYDRYFAGTDTAVAIQLLDVLPLRRRVPLSELRQRVIGFRPPQSFCYLPCADATALSSTASV